MNKIWKIYIDYMAPLAIENAFLGGGPIRRLVVS